MKLMTTQFLSISGLALVFLMVACVSPPKKGEFCVFRKGGSGPGNYVNCIVQDHFEDLKKCYEDSLAAKTYEELKILFIFKVAPDGTTSKVSYHARKRYKKMATCQKKVFERMSFTELAKAEIPEGRYTFWVRPNISEE